ncbi:MAG TPA: hypothetical protein VJ926_03340 [Patescibacteria group bacterium]|nr:hypothetical protein [Patescibacteria group bacterium]
MLSNKLENINSEETKTENNKPEKLKEILGELNFRESNQEEKERLTERIPQEKKNALKTCANIFNKNCDYPWYVTGSIAFLINAKESKKQPDDIDIIFHENDFEKVAEKFKEIGFTEGIAKQTNCPFIKGSIEVEYLNSEGDIENKTIEMEAFGQSTENPNGLINPGAKESKYNIIKNSLSEKSEENFNILDKEAQTELYIKNLLEEIKGFNFDSTLKDIKEKGEEFYESDKSKKFAFRLANLFELNHNNTREIILRSKEIIGNDNEKMNTLRSFMKIAKEFSKIPKEDNEIDENDDGLTNVFNEGHLQESIIRLQEKIEFEKKEIINIYSNIENKYNNLSSLSKSEKEDLKKEITQKIFEKENTIGEFLDYNKNINKEKNYYKDLPLYTFIIIFRDNYIEPFCKKMKKISDEL